MPSLTRSDKPGAADQLDAFGRAFYGTLHAEGPVHYDAKPIDPDWQPID